MDRLIYLMLRMTRWIRHPPSRTQLLVLAGVAILVVAVVGLDYLGLWPDALKVERSPRLVPSFHH